MRAVIYARYSAGPNQTEQSIEGQIRECKEFAKRNDITIIGTYIDRSVSGKTDERPEFQRMIRDSEKKLFEAVIVYRLDRFSRNRYDSATYRARLKKNGVKVLSAKENITDSPEGIIMEALLEGMAEYYSAELSQKIRRGMKESALKCKATNGSPGLGYKISPDKKFEIDPSTAPLVVRIFEMYDSGKTIKEIQDILNEQGYRTSNNGEFNKNSFNKLLKNRKYIGVYERAGIVIEGGVPAIVERDLFDRVQEKMEKNKKAPGRSKSPMDYLLTTKIFCGKCGSNMVGESGTGRSQLYHYYTCTSRRRSKKCDKENVKKDFIERFVVATILEKVLANDEVIEHIAERIILVMENANKNDDVVSGIKANIKETEKGINNIIKAIEQGIITDSTKQRLVELEELKADYEMQLLREESSKPNLTKKILVDWLSTFKDGDIDNTEFQKRIIDTQLLLLLSRPSRTAFLIKIRFIILDNLIFCT